MTLLSSTRISPSGPSTIPDVAFVGEFPSSSDMLHGTYLSGSLGKDFDSMVHDAGLLRSTAYITTILKHRPRTWNPDDLVESAKSKGIAKGFTLYKGRWIHPSLPPLIEQTLEELRAVKPKIIVTLGDFATWAVTGESGIGKWRGSQLWWQGIPLVPTYDPAVVVRQWNWRVILVQDLRRARIWRDSGCPREPSYSFTTLRTFDAAASYLQSLIQRANGGPLPLAIDIETANREIDCIGFATSSHEAHCIPILCSDRVDGYWTPDEEYNIVRLIRTLLRHPNILPIGQNYSYDLYYLAFCWGILPKCHGDTMLQHHTLFPGTQKSLDYLSSMYCSYHVYWKDDIRTKAKEASDEKHWLYNCKDARTTFEIWEILTSVIQSQGFQEQYAFQLRRMLSALRTTLYGVRINKTMRGEMSMKLFDAIASREQWLTDILGHPLNAKSPKQLQKLFYEDFQLKPIKARAKKGVAGNVTTNTEALETIAQREPLLKPICDVLVELRSLGVFLSTFVQAPIDQDGRIRCSYNIAGTETFRFSSNSNPMGTGTNLQNIPKGTEK